jgi:hypothetical protein
MVSARFAGNFGAFAENAISLAPTSFDNLRARMPIDSVSVQVARFRGSHPGVADVSLFADIPTSRMLRDTDVSQALLETAFFLTDANRQTSREAHDSAIVKLDRPDAVAERSWRRTLPPGSYIYRVEAQQRVSGRAARGLAALSVRDYPEGEFLLSDILVARRIGLKSGGGKPHSRDDLLITPSGSLSFAAGDTIYLYWETYGLARDSATQAGRAKVELALRVDRLQRDNQVSVILGGIGDALGLTAKGDDRVSLSYERTVTPDALDRAPDYLALSIGNSPPGTYTLEIRVTDLTTQKTTTQQRILTVRAR